MIPLYMMPEHPLRYAVIPDGRITGFAGGIAVCRDADSADRLQLRVKHIAPIICRASASYGWPVATLTAVYSYPYLESGRHSAGSYSGALALAWPIHPDDQNTDNIPDKPTAESGNIETLQFVRRRLLIAADAHHRNETWLYWTHNGRSHIVRRQFESVDDYAPAPAVRWFYDPKPLPRGAGYWLLNEGPAAFPVVAWAAPDTRLKIERNWGFDFFPRVTGNHTEAMRPVCPEYQGEMSRAAIVTDGWRSGYATAADIKRRRAAERMLGIAVF